MGKEVDILVTFAILINIIIATLFITSTMKMGAERTAQYLTPDKCSHARLLLHPVRLAGQELGCPF